VQENDTLVYQRVLPDDLLADCVKCFWYLNNNTTEEKLFTILPDGYFDILFFSINNQPLKFYLMGLGTKPTEFIFPINATVFAISFKLLAAEYILATSISSLVNKTKYLPNNFWDIEPSGFSDFDNFVHIVTKKITDRLEKRIDLRKQNLFSTLYASNGSITVEQVSASIYWNSRQINHYFKTWFGISLKAYCNILRYRASFEQLKEGQLFPEQDYFDQAHFIKDVKKFSGVTPKHLAENKNDRFIQLSTLSGQ
jgi:AraC-like DNA-binding protein